MYHQSTLGNGVFRKIRAPNPIVATGACSIGATHRLTSSNVSPGAAWAHAKAVVTPHGSFVMGTGDPNEPKSYDIGQSRQFLEEVTRAACDILPPLRDV